MAAPVGLFSPSISTATRAALMMCFFSIKIRVLFQEAFLTEEAQLQEPPTPNHGQLQAQHRPNCTSNTHSYANSYANCTTASKTYTDTKVSSNPETSPNSAAGPLTRHQP